ncbi:two-component system sensor histidine kinase NtrB [Sporomusa acidovorans]|uniref:histidine kinase n=1 Tax=Sporomusa acidovorans (strain ATCC 49682 / DSM 3132 / Mol) TaxID=1123286 RepID=A0ABZ3J583_SPOA4|nr:ATP-binding protein [Sporomusa acidovorans]OZC13387.1 sporulation kinase E [Sporomusa acidovorans DSM 3132]SDF78606.1 two-component system, NtrC family, sensor histidine kinase AtoS [Sporomusa acidovorans]
MSAAEALNSKIVYLHRDEDYQDAIDTSTGIIFLDNELRVKNLNREAEKICGVERARSIGRRVDDVFKQHGDKFLQAFYLEEYEDLNTVNLKLKVQDQFSYVHIDTLKLRGNAGQANGLIVIIQDLSAVRAAIKQIQVTQMLMSLGELAAGVAHHVRTPLTTISGYLQVMLGRLEDDRYTVGKDVLEMLLDEVSSINRVVKELVLFAKPPVNKENNIDINRTIEEALLLTFKQLGGEKIDIDKQLASNLPVLSVDSNLIKQAIVNVMQNAMEAMPGEGVLSVRTWINSELSMLVIAISDTGLGVSPEILPKIFEPFYTTKLEHMGLGLPIAHRIIGEHGGFININPDNPIGSGACIHIYLPIIDERHRHLRVVHQQILNLQ